MSATAITFFVVLTLVGFVMSALYSGLETGLYTLNRVRLTVRASRAQRRAVRLRRLLARSNRTLIVLLIGTNASNYLGSYGVAELLHAAGLTDWTLIVLQTALFTPLLFVFAETLPKDLFRTHTDRWTYKLSAVISVSRVVFTLTGLVPLIQLVIRGVARLLREPGAYAVTARQRISQLIKEGVGVGVLSHGQATLTDRVLSMRDVRVGRVMVPWSHVVTVPVDAAASAREALIRARNFTRLPVVKEGGRVVGVLTWSDAVLDREAPTSALMRPVISFPPRARLLDALSSMREQRASLAIVQDPDSGRPAGLVTLKDLVEPLTGELGAW